MARVQGNMADILYEAYMMFQNALAQEEVLRAFRAFDVDEAWLEEGMVLYERAEALDVAQTGAYGEQYAATDALKTRWAEVDRVYKFHREIARRTFKGEREVVELLGLKGRHPIRLGAWLRQADQFYTGLLEEAEVLRVLRERWRLTVARVRENAEGVEAVRALDVAQEYKKAAAQRATQERNEAVRTLQRKMGDLKLVAKMVGVELIMNRG